MRLICSMSMLTARQVVMCDLFAGEFASRERACMRKMLVSGAVDDFSFALLIFVCRWTCRRKTLQACATVSDWLRSDLLRFVFVWSRLQCACSRWYAKWSEMAHLATSQRVCHAWPFTVGPVIVDGTERHTVCFACTDVNGNGCCDARRKVLVVLCVVDL